MKEIILVSVLSLFISAAHAQGMTSLHENFDVDCVVSGEMPAATQWSVYNPVTATIPWGQWTCSPCCGRPTSFGTPTPGIQCTDTFNNMYHTDTSYLITPLLDMRSYTSVFLQFDSKTSRIVYGPDLSVLLVYDSTLPGPGSLDISDSVAPIIGHYDSSEWVTHLVDLKYYNTRPFYIAFRYTSTDTTGLIWFLDNINTTTVNIMLGTPVENKDIVQLTVLGFATENKIDFSYTTTEPGEYKVAIFDMVGREVYHEQLNAGTGASNYSITGLDLSRGMYLLKMGNDHSSGVAKIVVQ